MLLRSSLLIASIYAGIQGLFVTGVHTDIAGAQRGVAPGALIELGARWKRLELRAEGIPPVSLPQKPSEFYGQSTPQLSLINGALRYALDPQSRFSAGMGMTVINQKTPLPNLNQVVASRLAGARYEFMYAAPLRGSHVLEIVAGGAPRLTGADHFTWSVPHPGRDRGEIASEIDGQVAWGIVSGSSEFLFGLRSINFSAQFTDNGEAADRNNGGGVMAEWRRFFNR